MPGEEKESPQTDLKVPEAVTAGVVPLETSEAVMSKRMRTVWFDPVEGVRALRAEIWVEVQT